VSEPAAGGKALLAGTAPVDFGRPLQ